MAGTIRIGTSGFSYSHWRGTFFPQDLPQSRWLEYYCHQFDTVELDNPFYRLPQKKTFEGWAQRSPDGFVFSVKASRYVTHRKKLNDVKEPVARMLANYDGLGQKLGPVLFQFPATWSQNLDRLADLLDVLPSRQAYAFEFRHESWLTRDTYELLRRHGCALCIPDSPSLPRALEVTAPFTMIRMHGGRDLPESEYSEKELKQWASRIAAMSSADIDVFVYFNNDAHGFAIANARRLKSMLGQATSATSAALA